MSRLVCLGLMPVVLGGCSILLDPDEYLSDGGTDAGVADAGPTTDGPEADAGPSPRCEPVPSPATICSNSVDVDTVETLLASYPARHAVAVVEHGEGVAAAVCAITEDLTRLDLEYHLLRPEGPDRSAADTLEVLGAVAGSTGHDPSPIRTHAMRRTGPGSLGLLFLSDEVVAGGSDVWHVDVVDGAVERAANLSARGSVIETFGTPALTGAGGERPPRFFWREKPSDSEFSLLSMPFDTWGVTELRSTQYDVDRSSSSTTVSGSDGDFVLATSNVSNELLLWSGLGASATAPSDWGTASQPESYVDPAASTISGNIALAWIVGDRYVLFYSVSTADGIDVLAVPADCAVSCGAGDPEVCTNSCTFHDAVTIKSYPGVVAPLVAATGAGPNAVAVALAPRSDSGGAEAVFSILDATSLEPLPEPVPHDRSLGVPGDSVRSLAIASLATGSALDVVIGWSHRSGAYFLTSYRPCLCD